jgi:hypothetical protein
VQSGALDSATETSIVLNALSTPGMTPRSKITGRAAPISPEPTLEPGITGKRTD